MASNYVDDLIDGDEIPELTEEDAKHFAPFAELPLEMQQSLLAMKEATIRPDAVKKPITVNISSDVLAKFEKTGEGWEARLDDALRQWLDEHPLPVGLAKAS